MIRYALSCKADHRFESWFASAAAFESLRDGGRLACPDCGSTEIAKALMAPAVATREDRPDLTSPRRDIEAALAEMRRKIEATSDYVGMNFAAEARAIHEGEAPERSIYGEARPEEARALLEDGIPVAPLPFLPHRKSN